MPMREPGWWTFALGLAGALSRPRPDAAASDRAIEGLASDSAVLGAFQSAADRVGRAASDSRVVSAVAPQLDAWRAIDAATRWRASAWIMLLAGLISLVGHLATPRAVGPLGWVLPSIAMAAGAMIVALGGLRAARVGGNGR
jgi:hypothetical protein